MTWYFFRKTGTVRVEEPQTAIPPGALIFRIDDSTGTPTPAPGWLLCDGSVVQKSRYPALYNLIGSSFNDGTEASNQFRLPNADELYLIGASSLYPVASIDRSVDRRSHQHGGAMNQPHYHRMQNDHTHVMPDHVHPLQGHTHHYGHTHGPGSLEVDDNTTSELGDATGSNSMARAFHDHADIPSGRSGGPNTGPLLGPTTTENTAPDGGGTTQDVEWLGGSQRSYATNPSIYNVEDILPPFLSVYFMVKT